jgi:hypothetical protein
VLKTTFKMYQVGNVYVIAAVAVVGGALFGFDIRFVFRKYFLHNCDVYFSEENVTLTCCTVPCPPSSPQTLISAISIKAPIIGTPIKNALVPGP